MAQRQTSFERKLKFGEEGEHEVAQYLIQRGVSILPLYQFDKGEAPVIFSAKTQIISPDLICFKDDAFMVEVKTKNQWVMHRGRVETGLDLKHYNHYKQIACITGKDVYVFFNQKKQEPTGMFYCNLDKYTRVWDGTARGRKVHPEMVFYNIEILNRVK